MSEPLSKGEVITSRANIQEPKSREEKEKARAADKFNKKSGRASMAIKVYSPVRVYFDGLAFSLTAKNKTGEFDILPKHHPFICLLEPCTMVVRTLEEGDKNITISGGLLHVKEDKVIVFLDV